jgi:ethanolamine utilization protein EutN
VGIVDSVHVKRPPKARGFAHAGSQEGAEIMLIARVIGELVATQKHASHEGRKVLLVQPLNLDGSDRGDAVVALDAVDAGVGDRVLLVTEGFSAMTAVGRPQSPIDMAVIGFIDHIDLIPGVE